VTSYEDAGVNLSAADELVDRIGWRVTSTWTEDVVGAFGGFAAGIQVPAGFIHPVLMMSTDGVGTKAEVARQAGLLDGLGYDLLATVADDLSAAGAQPIAMTDYIAVGRLDVDRVETIVESITDACNESDVALLGGETAEHPGVMPPDQFDLAATALGIVELGEEVDASHVQPGDVIIGVKSSNLRANGFSLVRAVVAKSLPLDSTFPDTDMPTAEVLLEPSVVYSPARSRWEVPHVFNVIQQLGEISLGDMFRTFNMGIGFTCVVGEADVDATVAAFETSDLDAVVIGRITEGDRGVELR